MCDILKMAGRRAIRSEMWDSMVLVAHTWRIFDLGGFKVILGSFGAVGQNKIR